MICSSYWYCFLCSVPVSYLGYRKRLQHTPGICLGALGYLYTKAKYTCYSAAMLRYAMLILLMFYIRKVTQMARRPSWWRGTPGPGVRASIRWPPIRYCGHWLRQSAQGATARKYLAVPATSVPSERLFLDSRHVMGKRRTRLSAQIFGKIVFCQGNCQHFGDMFPEIEDVDEDAQESGKTN